MYWICAGTAVSQILEAASADSQLKMEKILPWRLPNYSDIEPMGFQMESRYNINPVLVLPHLFLQVFFEISTVFSDYMPAQKSIKLKITH